MPQKFDECVASGGRVRTKVINAKQFIHICWPKGGGPPVHGEVKVKKGK